jgi:hypothetical protein
MTQVAINYVVNPFSQILKTVRYALELRGMVRAADEMYRLGYIKEYQETMQRVRDMRAS